MFELLKFDSKFDKSQLHPISAAFECNPTVELQTEIRINRYIYINYMGHGNNYLKLAKL